MPDEAEVVRRSLAHAKVMGTLQTINPSAFAMAQTAAQMAAQTVLKASLFDSSLVAVQSQLAEYARNQTALASEVLRSAHHWNTLLTFV